MPGMITPMLRFLRLAFWLGATLAGSTATVSALAGFGEPRFGLYAVAWFASAVALLYARDVTPASL